MIQETLYGYGGSIINIPTHFSHYTYIQTIGKGSNAVVIQCLDDNTNQYVACKVVDRRELNDYGSLIHFEKELRILERIRHPNIVQIYEIIYLKDCIVIVMEYCPYGDLHDYIYHTNYITDQEIIQIATQLLGALTYLHSNGLTHRDIKPENIVFDRLMNVKLIDFGLSNESNKLMTTKCGSPYYIAPEIAKGEAYDGPAADMWSFGMVMYYLLTGDLPWKTDNEAIVLRDLHRGNIKIEKKVIGKLSPLVDRTLLLEPKERATAADLLHYLAGFSQCASLPIIKNGFFSQIKITHAHSAMKPSDNKVKILIRPTDKNITKPAVNHNHGMKLSKNKRTTSSPLPLTLKQSNYQI